jgi:hypothetical protein
VTADHNIFTGRAFTATPEKEVEINMRDSITKVKKATIEMDIKDMTSGRIRKGILITMLRKVKGLESYKILINIWILSLLTKKPAPVSTKTLFSNLNCIAH